MNGDESIGATVRKMMTDAVVAALSDQTPPTPDTERLAKMYERLWSAFEDSRARIEYLEVQLTHFADLRWKN